MKPVRIAFATVILYLAVFASGTQFSACKKTVTVHDTIVKKDTLVTVDSTRGLREDMVAYYTFTGGSTQDSSGMNNHITFNTASKTTDRFGRANNAYFFDGVSSYMKVANSASLNPAKITIAVIIKPTAFNKAACAGNQIIAKGSGDHVDGFYLMRYSSVTGCGNTPDTTREFVYGGYGNNNTSGMNTVNADSSFIKAGQWYQFVFTYDGYETRIYINGMLKNISFGTVPFTPNTAELFIGKMDSSPYPYYMTGAIDEIRIYNKPLSGYSVKQLYNLSLTQ